MITARRVTKGGFVPVELLAVVCVVVLLAGIVMPSVSRLKSQTASLRCMGNHRQIVQAWQLYAQDNGGTNANNFTIPETFNSIATRKYDNWVNGVVTWSLTSDIPNPDITNQFRIFRPYHGNDFDIYRCPADNFVSAQQRHRGFSKRVRSVSMNALVGRNDTSANSALGRSWFDGGLHRQWLKLRDIQNPAKTWVTIDEHPDSINDGLFYVPISTATWGDIPGALHARSTSFSFADGHVESRKWRSKRTVVPVRFNYVPPGSFDAAGRQDHAWYIAHSGFVRH